MLLTFFLTSYFCLVQSQNVSNFKSNETDRPVIVDIPINIQDVKKLPIDVRIVNGTKVNDMSGFAYQVSLRQYKKHYCGGSILSNQYILTAAHCSESEGRPISTAPLSVLAGTPDLTSVSSVYQQELKVDKIYIHPLYNDTTLVNDLAIWRLSGNLTWNKNVKRIKIADEIEYKMPFPNCNVSGWGVTKPENKYSVNELLYVEIPLISRTYCRQIYGYNQISNEMVCAGSIGKDSCQGDSGGPLVCNHKLTGIVSFGFSCGKYPGVYTEAAKFKDWIDSKILEGSGSTIQKVSIILLSCLMFIYTF